MSKKQLSILGDWIVWSTKDRIHFGSSLAEATFDKGSGFFYCQLEPQGLLKLVPFYTKSVVYD